ncbi:hypothetical protein HYDPIDRAFT_33341 [Hydnomerulius pinastri MD-312]|uniref:F-box domain-containing protein n=1 Tax=Hydnomerulius pinastri MD-312 TaxID=994086 RepID=A0A0C9W8C6_9AGAM|nr:hypothetical protein HYDPIDRAFT_33341 [Hydnomerulius pinastri MD-312]
MAMDIEVEEGGENTTEPQGARQALRNLAITCKTLRDPALDVLWRDLDSLYPLLGCLPVEIQGRSDGSLRINRVLEKSDYGIFNKYARRVRMLGYNQRHSYMNRDLLRLLSSFPCSQGTVLLSNLKCLTWEGDSDELFTFVRFFVPPSLLSLHLVGSRWPLCKRTFVSLLPLHLPKLMEFLCSDPTPEVMPHINEYICQSKGLTAIDAGVPSAKAMKHLMSSTTLKQLHISIPRHDNWEPVEGTFLPNVTHFIFRAHNLDKATEFLRNVKLSPTHAVIMLSDVFDGSSVTAFFEQLSTSLDHHSLQELHYQISDVVNNPAFSHYTSELEVNTLTPLLVFKNLVKLRLENFRTPLIDDKMAKRMADAWPHLEDLKIGTGQDWQMDTGFLRKSQMTLWGVGYIAQHCPKLKILGLVFDPEVHCAMIPAGWSNSNIRRLDVGASPIDNSVRVAATLLFLLPELEEIWTKQPRMGYIPVGVPEDKRAEKWTLVLEMVNVFASVREVAKTEAVLQAKKAIWKELAEKGMKFRFLTVKSETTPPGKEEEQGAETEPEDA